jgi:hypothetical protein
MIETLLVLLGLGAMAALALLPWPWLLEAGAVLTALGFAVGLPPALVYHLRLRAALLRRGRLVRRWWLEPTRLHRFLETEDRRRVMPWFTAGAAGFVLVVLGCVLVVLAALGSLRGLPPHAAAP